MQIYKDWNIMILSVDAAWQFFVAPPASAGEAEPLSDHKNYPDAEAAYRHACRFIDRQLVREDIDQLLDPLVEADILPPSTYACLLRLIGQLMRF